jgi:glutaredoxin
MWAAVRRLLPPRTKTSAANAVEVVVYSRNGCHLCEEAKALLEKEQRRYPFALSVVDVDSDPELVRLFAEEVPVVQINGKVYFRGTMNAALFRRILRRRQP